MDIVSDLLEAIKNEDIDTVRTLMETIPLASLQDSVSEEFLRLAMIESYESNNDDIPVAILKIWNDIFPEEQYLSGQNTILSFNEFKDDFYIWFVNLFDLTYKDYVINLTKTNVPRATIILNRLDKLFQSLSEQEYQDIIDVLDDMFLAYNIDYGHIRSVMKENIQNVSKVVDKPDFDVYDTDNTSHEVLMSSIRDIESNIPFTMTPIKVAEMVYTTLNNRNAKEANGFENTLLDDFRNKNPTIVVEEIRIGEVEDVDELDSSGLCLALTQKSMREVYNLVPKVGEVFNEEIEQLMFRILGPSSPPLSRVEFDAQDPCSKYGGCRMLTCWEYKNDDFDDEPENYEEEYWNYEWFTGYCEYCDKGIAEKHYAVRKPLKGGSWRGCFCSWNCVRDSTDDIVVKSLCDYFEKQYKKFGIFDREWNPPSNLANFFVSEEIDDLVNIINAEDPYDDELAVPNFTTEIREINPMVKSIDIHYEDI
jgi:hypothetical protein